MKPTLVIMAAGMGSRYGGLKQLDSMGPNGEIIMDYSIYDSLRAGFGKVVFIIKKEIEEAFRDKIGKTIEKIVDTDYVYQDINDIPKGYVVPEGRVKPWGTGHAILCSEKAVKTNFAVINADDFYGYSSYKVIGEYLSNLKDDESFYQYAMVGYNIENTITEHGHVSRGICSIDEAEYLTDIVERTKIARMGRAIEFTEDGVKWTQIPNGTKVSMNMWGFTPSIFSELQTKFSEFMEENNINKNQDMQSSQQSLKAEFFLPTAVGELVSVGKAKVRVLPSKERWYGVTYAEDKDSVKAAIEEMIRVDKYPKKLWKE